MSLGTRIASAWSALVGAPPRKRSLEYGPLGYGTYYAGAALYGGGWIQSLRSKDEEIRRDALALRANSRRLANNNPFMKRYLRAIGGHVIGPNGMTLQSTYRTQAGDRRDPYAGRIEAAWEKWGRKGTPTTCGEYSWLDVERLAVRTTALDGECFLRIVRGADNPFRFALQFLDADLLDPTQNWINADGSAVIMGVEMDAWGKRRGYWFTDPADARTQYPRGRKLYLPAADIIHLKDPERATQTRGVPWIAPVMYLMSMLGHYWEAEVAAARHESERPGFLKDPHGVLDIDEEREGQGVAAMEPQAAAARMPANTGIQYMGIPAGLEIDIPDVKHPTTAFSEFSKAMLKGIASGLGVSYSTLASDLTEVSFSSIRSGTLEDREYYRELQGLARQSLHERVFVDWLYMAVLSGQVTMPASAAFERFSSHSFEPRGWDWVDPKSDMLAKVGAIDAGLDTRTRVLAERGLNFQDVMQQLAEEQAVMKELGVVLKSPSKAPDPQPPASGDEEASHGNP